MNKGTGFRQGIGLASRLGVELTVATAIGGLMGYALDDFLDTEPWCLAAGVILGGAAGCLNVYRTAMNVEFEDDSDDDIKDDN